MMPSTKLFKAEAKKEPQGEWKTEMDKGETGAATYTRERKRERETEMDKVN